MKGAVVLKARTGQGFLLIFQFLSDR